MFALRFSTVSSLSVFLFFLSQTTPSSATPSINDQSIVARDAEPFDGTLALRDIAESLLARDFDERDFYERDFEERDAEPAKGSRLDFAGHVIDAAGNIVPSVVNVATGHKRGFQERDFEERDLYERDFEERDFYERDFEERDFEERDFEERDAEAAKGSRLDFAGHVVDATGNIVPAVINAATGHHQKRDFEERDAFKLPFVSLIPDVINSASGNRKQQRDLGERDFEERDAKITAGGFLKDAEKVLSILKRRDFEERDAKVTASTVLKDAEKILSILKQRDFQERAAALPHSRGSKLDFAGRVIDAAGNVIGGLGRRDFAERDAYKLPFNLMKLGGSAINTRDSGERVPRSRGSKLDFAGNVISAGGNIADAFGPKRDLEAQRYPSPQVKQD